MAKRKKNDLCKQSSDLYTMDVTVDVGVNEIGYWASVNFDSVVRYLNHDGELIDRCNPFCSPKRGYFKTLEDMNEVMVASYYPFKEVRETADGFEVL